MTSVRYVADSPLTSSAKYSARFFDYEDAATFLVMLYFALKIQPFVVLVDVPGAVSSVLFPAMCVGVLLLTPRTCLARLPISLPLWTLAAWQTASYQWTEVPFSTLFLIRSEVVPLLCFTLVAAVIRPAILVRRLVLFFCLVVGWSLLTSLILPASRSLVATNGQPGFRGTFAHKNLLGIFAVFTLSMIIAFVHNRWRPFLVAMSVVTIVGTRSATAGSGLLAVLFVWFWMSAVDGQRTQVDRSFLRIMSIASLAMSFLLGIGFLSSFLDLYGKDVTFSGRTVIWDESLTTVMRQPLHGYGLGGVWSDGRSPVTADLQQRIGFAPAHAHNGAIEILLEVGVVGLALTLIFLLSTMRLASRCSQINDARNAGRWAALSIIAIVLMSVSEPLFSRAWFALPVLIWVVLSGYVTESTGERRVARSARR